MVDYMEFADRVAESGSASLAPRLRTAMHTAIDSYVNSQVRMYVYVRVRSCVCVCA